MGLFTKLFGKKLLSQPLSLPPKEGFFFIPANNISVTWDNYAMDRQMNDKLIAHYNELAEISAPILKPALAAKQVIPEFYVKQQSGKLKTLNEKHPFYKPFMEFWQKYADLLIIHKRLLGNVYLHAFESGKFIDNQFKKTIDSFILLPPQRTKIKVNPGSDFRMPEITSYDIKLINKPDVVYSFDPTKTLHIKTNNPLFDNDFYLYGISPLVSVEKNIRSIASGYSAKVNLYEHGPRVIITGKAQGEFASANVDSDKETVKFLDRLNNRYGLTEGQYQVMGTHVPLDVNMISNNVGQLQITENNIADYERICSVQQIDPLVVSSNISSTFSNKEIAESNFYNGTFKQEIDDIFLQITYFLNRFDESIVAKPSYYNIPEIVAEEKKKNAELLELAKMGLLTRNEYMIEAGWPSINEPSYNEYYVFSNNNWIPVNNGHNEITEGTGNDEGAN